MSGDTCPTITLNVILQENGIIRNSHGLFLGRLDNDLSYEYIKTIEEAGYMPVDEINDDRMYEYEGYSIIVHFRPEYESHSYEWEILKNKVLVAHDPTSMTTPQSSLDMAKQYIDDLTEEDSIPAILNDLKESIKNPDIDFQLRRAAINMIKFLEDYG